MISKSSEYFSNLPRKKWHFEFLKPQQQQQQQQNMFYDDFS